MSLFVLLDPLIASDEFKAHCVFFMALMAFATVLINGSTSKYVLQGLGLLSMTQQQRDVLQHVLQVGLGGKVRACACVSVLLCSAHALCNASRRHFSVGYLLFYAIEHPNLQLACTSNDRQHMQPCFPPACLRCRKSTVCQMPC